MLINELVVVEVCAVGREEEYAREEKFVVDAVALWTVSIFTSVLSRVLAHTLNFSAASGPCPRSTKVWRASGCRSKALAIHLNASCETATSFSLKA